VTTNQLTVHYSCFGNWANLPLFAPNPLEQQQPKIIRLPRNGPKNGMSTEAWLRGKSKGDEKWDKKREKEMWKLMRNTTAKESKWS